MLAQIILLSVMLKVTFLTLCINTPGTRGGSGFGNLTLAVKSRKNAQKSVFAIFSSNAKIWGVPPKWVKSRRRREREEQKSMNTMVSKTKSMHLTLYCDP